VLSQKKSNPTYKNLIFFAKIGILFIESYFKEIIIKKIKTVLYPFLKAICVVIHLKQRTKL
jgi:hypothetical protein